MFKSLGVILTSLAAFVSLSVLAGSIDEFVRDAVEDQSRIDAARQRDEGRKPAEILAFSGISPGDTVLEIAPGGGYYTGLLSRVVGETGKVYAVDPERICCVVAAIGIECFECQRNLLLHLGKVFAKFILCRKGSAWLHTPDITLEGSVDPSKPTSWISLSYTTVGRVKSSKVVKRLFRVQS